MAIERTFFKNHHLELSVKKSKVMSHNSATGKTTFDNNEDHDDFSLESVVAFKYLGITLNSSPSGFFKTHNENAKAKAKQYLQSILALVKTGPDRASLVYTLWTSCALPAILYGCEVAPLNQGTIQEIERCQSRVGKFMLQIPTSSSSVVTNIDCGFKPVCWTLAERVLMYVSNLSSKSSSYWPKIALLEQINMNPTSPFMKYLKKWKDATQTYGVTPKQIRKNVKHYAIKDIKQSKFDTCTTSFALNCPGTTTKNHWFRPKPWITDSSFKKIFSEFRTCNIGMGNRGPTKDGRFYKLCPLCSTDDQPYLNNEACINYYRTLFMF